jgi:N-acetylmuramoyl-L-alanine amidase/predicted Ser/Thr protein kinase
MESSPISSQALPSGTRIEEFVIERVLGSGGFGITYLAKDTSLGRQVVIKENLPVQFAFRDPGTLRVAPRHTQGDDAENFQWSLENFSKEAAMLAGLDHPGIVKVLRSFEAFGTAYFVMPFVEGKTLDEIASKRKWAGRDFTEEELQEIVEPMLDALSYLHDRGIYHRDIKPGNILITTGNTPVLIDFGAARQLLSGRSMTVVESAGYTPFEQLQTRGNVGPWSDLYALAATVVKIMTGETPPKANDRTMGDSWEPLAYRHELKERYLQSFLTSHDRALRLPTEQRWQSAKAWKDALAVVSQHKVDPGRMGNARSDGADNLSKPSGRRTWAMVVAPILGLLASVVWLSIFGGQMGERGELPAMMPGSLVVTSEPPGAHLKDATGNLLGTTPIEVKELTGGRSWEGTLELEGYITSKVVELVVSGATQRALTVKLVPAPQKLVVTSEPKEAEVLEDGKVLGVTPWEGRLTEVGSEVKLGLRKRDYEEMLVSGTVALGKTLELHGSLKASMQEILVSSEPAGADVIENGSIIGVTPFKRSAVPGTVADLTLRFDGHDDGNVKGTVKVGETLELLGKLKPRRAVENADNSDVYPNVFVRKTPGKNENPGKATHSWHVVKIGDLEYISIESIQGFYNFEKRYWKENEIVLENQKVKVRFRIGSNFCIMNDVRFCLFAPIISQDEMIFVSKADLAKVLDPVLRPNSVKGAKDFRTVILDPMLRVRNSDGDGLHAKGSEAALEVAQLAQSLLSAKGFKVLLTRKSTANISIDKRIEKVNAVKEPAVVIMIGFAAGGPEERGVRTFACDPTTPEATKSQIDAYASSLGLATSVHGSVLRRLQNNTLDGGVSRIQDSFMSQVKHPVILLEGGFVTHPDEARLINDQTYQNALANALVDAIIKYGYAVGRPAAAVYPDLTAQQQYLEYLRNLRDEQIEKKRATETEE